MRDLWHAGESGMVKERRQDSRRRSLRSPPQGGTRWFFKCTPMTNLMAGIKSKQADSGPAVEVENAAAFKSPHPSNSQERNGHLPTSR